MKGGLSGISGAMEQLSEKREYLGLRKIFALGTILSLIGLLACSGPAPTPEYSATTPPAKSEAMLEETATEASSQIATETPDRINATTAPTTVSPVPKATLMITVVPTAPTSVPEPTIPAPNPTSSGVTPAPTPATNTTTSVPTTAIATSTPASILTTTPVITRVPAPSTTTLTIAVAPIPSDVPEYSRSQWKHWTDADGDCQDARQEVLIAESLVEVTFESAKMCRVETGRWYGAFTGSSVELPGDLDVDHLVPLKNAHLSGGWRWDLSRKAGYANYLDDADHLIAVTARANRSKGAKGPEEWRPPDKGYWCEYAGNWTEVKAQWGLTMTREESRAVVEMLEGCENPVKVVELKGTAAPDPTEEPERSVYGSCDEAEAAGATRVQGGQGVGRGFLKELVPSARDGDGDGVVCER